MLVRVFLNTVPEAMAFGYDHGHGLIEAITFDDQTLPDRDEAALEIVFTMLNVGADPDRGTPDQRAVDYRAAGHRSLSVGDVVGLDDRFYTCARSGWDLLEQPPLVPSTEQP